ncbi:MAG: family 10 glycosylhydrolase, partial [Cyclobacteriaceae bacterium]|nr:family 10 glycosylhydrolase [Cyclobacteriaceae bacterium]
MISNYKKIPRAFNCKIFGILLVIFAWGCAVRQPVKTGPGIPQQEFRAVIISSACLLNAAPDSTEILILKMLDELNQAHYNTLILDLNPSGNINRKIQSDSPQKDHMDFDPFLRVFEETHRQGLKVFVSVDLLAAGQAEVLLNHEFGPSRDLQEIPGPEESWYFKNNSNAILDPAVPEVRTYLKKIVRELVIQFDVDGLILDLTWLSGFPEEFSHATDPSPLTGLVEDIFTEAMLVKPYLINAASVHVDLMNGHPGIKQWTENGIVDFILPFNKNTSDMEHPGIIAGWQNGTVFYPGRVCHVLLENLTGPEYGYQEQKEFPGSLKKIMPEQVFSLDISGISGGRKGGESVEILTCGKTKQTDSEGRFGFILVEKPDTLKLRAAGFTYNLPTNRWNTPYDYRIGREGEVTRKIPWLEFRRMPEYITSDPEFHLLCKTDFPAKAWINGDTVKVYRTGIFFKKINLEEGRNRIEAGVIFPDSSRTTYTREFIYTEEEELREPFPLWIDEESVTPDMDMVLLPDDRVQLSFRGSKGQEGLVKFQPGNTAIHCNRTDFKDYSLYETVFSIDDWETDRKYSLSLILQANKKTGFNHKLEFRIPATITIRKFENFPWIRVRQNNTRLTYNLGPVRLGGPLKAEYPAGVILKTNGIFGNSYRVYLNPAEEGFVDMENVEKLPDIHSQLPYYITSLTCAPAGTADILSIPYPVQIPYAIFPEPELKRIRIRLYGAMTSSTWIAHREGCRYIERVTWEQVTFGTYEVQAYLKTSLIWGYEIHKEGSSLVLRIKYPPEFDIRNEKPLTGLKI